MMRERIIQVIDKSGLSKEELEKATGISFYKWNNLRTKKQRANEDHLEAINKNWPEYSYWVMTGETIPEAGQISPELEETRKRLKTGT